MAIEHELQVAVQLVIGLPAWMAYTCLLYINGACANSHYRATRREERHILMH